MDTVQVMVLALSTVSTRDLKASIEDLKLSLR